MVVFVIFLTEFRIVVSVMIVVYIKPLKFLYCSLILPAFSLRSAAVVLKADSNTESVENTGILYINTKIHVTVCSHESSPFEILNGCLLIITAGGGLLVNTAGNPVTISEKVESQTGESTFWPKFFPTTLGDLIFYLLQS